MYELDGLAAGDPAQDDAAAQRAWHEWCSDVHGNLSMSLNSEGSGLFRGRLVRQRSTTYQLIGWTSRSESVVRSARNVRRDPRGRYELLVPLRGDVFIGRDEPDFRLRSGAMALVPVDAPFAVAHASGAVALTLIMPCERMDGRAGRSSVLGQQVFGDRGLPRVARDLLVSVFRERDSLSSAAFESACDRAIDLFCLAAGETRGVESSGEGALLGAVRDYVLRHATDSNFSITAMAAAIGWSERYIQVVLARQETSVSGMVRAERLELARERLTNPGFDTHSIAWIASSVGFTSPSAFASAYRRHFDCTPRDARAAAAASTQRGVEHRGVEAVE